MTPDKLVGPRRIALTLLLATLSACGRSHDAGSSSAKGSAGVFFLVRVSRPVNGTIDSTDGQLHCGPAGGTANACGPARYAWSATATLTATPSAGMMFGAWGGDCAYRGPCVLDAHTSGADKWVAAIFGLPGEVGHGNFTSPAIHGPAYLDTLGGAPDSFSCATAGCHGAQLTGAGIAPSCDACHEKAGWAGWRTNCSFCHGARDAASMAGYDPAAHLDWAAPPDAVSQRLDGAPAPARAGAHQAHLQGITAAGQRLAGPFPCATCHSVPADLGHVRGASARAVVTLTTSTASGQVQLLGSYDALTGTCTTYCHGVSPSPAWGTPGIVCGSCHGMPPAAPHPAVSSAPAGCAMCHPGTVRSDGTIDVAGGKHVNGVVDVAFGAGGGAGCNACHGAPPATGAHVAHSGSQPDTTYGDTRITVNGPGLQIGCGNCHPTDPSSHLDGRQELVLNPALVLPGGTSTAGAQVSGTSTSTTCSVACHYPLGAPARTVSWSATGPLPCTSCHASINPGGAAPTERAGPSLHDPMFGDPRLTSSGTTCWSCHQASAHGASHLSGNAALLGSDGVSATCIACHSPPASPGAGAGQVLSSGGAPDAARTPPVLLGWTDAVNGDWHGSRAGTGSGGTLAAPYARRQGPLPCTACHAGHASRNAFLFAATVNGRVIPPNAIDRAGVGAEVLCSACHQGQRHAYCMSCHTDQRLANGGFGPGNPVDPQPAGSPCFYCHGHEGLRNFPSPEAPHGMNPPWDETCQHCHSVQDWTPVVSYQPPAWVAQPAATVTKGSAVIAWQTSGGGSTSWVEYGVGAPTYVAGSGALTNQHSVTLSGLAPSTTYVWRVRSSDSSRNVLTTALQSFTTPDPSVPSAPDLLPTADQYVDWGGSDLWTQLAWSPVTAPSGTAVQYQVQVGPNATFAGAVTAGFPSGGLVPATSPWLSSTAASVYVYGLVDPGCAVEGMNTGPGLTVFWRVRAQDAQGHTSPWSAAGAFTSYSQENCI
ncbi:CxxxxCH/CxxCH domain c-type cytochrome [Anaeromyxobacter paludicola]|uniref:Fibronectin type-III domain-containing protein n=1 Tax=Anaeromyxobacter paludicola TaxID=2918171 RepID=A0ABM7XBN5_9BACT|nr:hypothetical protein [Anaeromyxobacter paludicola]BDG09237.1 hypothetical protein AMPC_23500 [Anaeromyxobacter paludicola]